MKTFKNGFIIVDNSTFLSDLRGQIKDMVSDSFKTLEMNLLSKIRQEMDSVLAGYLEIYCKKL